PWGYMECNPDKFKVHHHEPAPSYDEQKTDHILSQRRNHPEREYFGADYQGSRYHSMLSYFPKDMTILDIACGSGFGSKLLAPISKEVVGVDYDPEAIKVNQERYSGVENLNFLTGDGQTFLYKDGAYFDCVISFHTLEHVPSDSAMMNQIYENLKPGGLAIVEVPLLAKRPLGKPVNPYHLREYEVQEVLGFFDNTRFKIEKVYGACRGIYVPSESARDALQVWARKHK
ncbi:MAG: class I SAM-dependent methyltransferase, partial [Eudoraea sp.]|nr:class I SAM-dependent methyltransferase [Eudoraea sp.]